MKVETFRIPEELWEEFKRKYGRKADARLRELIMEDLRRG